MGRNQKGFTLVELVVVIAIMGVMLTGGLLSFSLVVGQNVKGCTADVQGYIAQTRVESLSRPEGTVTLTLTSNDSGVYACMSVEKKTVKIGRPAIDVKYKVDDAAGSTYTLDSTNKLVLSFDKSSGAFQKLPSTCPGAGNYCTEIILSQGGRTLKIKLVPQTGKYYVENM